MIWLQALYIYCPIWFSLTDCVVRRRRSRQSKPSGSAARRMRRSSTITLANSGASEEGGVEVHRSWPRPARYVAVVWVPGYRTTIAPQRASLTHEGTGLFVETVLILLHACTGGDVRLRRSPEELYTSQQPAEPPPQTSGHPKYKTGIRPDWRQPALFFAASVPAKAGQPASELPPAGFCHVQPPR